MLATIPFSGFYESMHSAELDRTLEMLTQDDNGDQFVWNEGLEDEYTPGHDMWEHIDWTKAHNEYSKLYVSNFASYFTAETGVRFECTFDDLSSPREYNFTTDRIFVDVPSKVVNALWRKCKRANLEAMIAERFTSRDGFMSYYSNSLAVWAKKPLKEWDHNQLGTLIECVLLQFADRDWEWNIIEDADCNGDISNIVSDALTPEGNELVNEIYDYRNRIETFDAAQLTLIPLPTNYQRIHIRQLYRVA